MKLLRVSKRCRRLVEILMNRSKDVSATLLSVILFLGFLGLALAQVGQPIALADIEYLLGQGVSSNRLSRLVEERGIAFEATDAVIDRLKTAGASEALVVAIKEAAVAAAQKRLEQDRAQFEARMKSAKDSAAQGEKGRAETSDGTAPNVIKKEREPIQVACGRPLREDERKCEADDLDKVLRRMERGSCSTNIEDWPDGAPGHARGSMKLIMSCNGQKAFYFEGSKTDVWTKVCRAGCGERFHAVQCPPFDQTTWRCREL
jgi:hypothetical protein